MKRLAGFLVLFFAATQAPAQFVPGPPARAMYCLNPSGVWTAIATGLSASVLPNTPPAASAYGIGTDGAWHGLQCDASGNLILDGGPFLPITGGTLRGPLNGTDGNFSGAVAAGTAVTAPSLPVNVLSYGL